MVLDSARPDEILGEQVRTCCGVRVVIEHQSALAAPKAYRRGLQHAGARGGFAGGRTKIQRAASMAVVDDVSHDIYVACAAQQAAFAERHRAQSIAVSVAAAGADDGVAGDKDGGILACDGECGGRPGQILVGSDNQVVPNFQQGGLFHLGVDDAELADQGVARRGDAGTGSVKQQRRRLFIVSKLQHSPCARGASVAFDRDRAAVEHRDVNAPCLPRSGKIPAVDGKHGARAVDDQFSRAACISHGNVPGIDASAVAYFHPAIAAGRIADVEMPIGVGDGEPGAFSGNDKLTVSGRAHLKRVRGRQCRAMNVQHSFAAGGGADGNGPERELRALNQRERRIVARRRAYVQRRAGKLGIGGGNADRLGSRHVAIDSDGSA